MILKGKRGAGDNFFFAASRPALLFYLRVRSVIGFMTRLARLPFRKRMAVPGCPIFPFPE